MPAIIDRETIIMVSWTCRSLFFAASNPLIHPRTSKSAAHSRRSLTRQATPMQTAYIEDITDKQRFDSSIDPPFLSEDRENFDFTLKLKVFLQQVNPPKGQRTFQAQAVDGQRWAAQAWNNAA